MIPALSKGWKFERTPSEIIITLHSNHRFYDGSFVQAKNVVESLKQLCRNQPLHLSSLFASIEGCDNESGFQANVRELDAVNLAIKISSTPSAFLHQLSSVGASIFKTGKNGLLGSGPYQAKLAPNGNMELIRNPYYHDKLSIRNNGILLVYRPEKDTLQNLTEFKPAGSVMLLSNLGGNLDIKDYYRTPHIPYITQTLVLNPQKYPLNNAELRKAIQADFYNHGRLHECGSLAAQSYGFIPYGIGGSFGVLPNELINEDSSKKLSKHLKRLENKPVQLKIYRHLGRKSECEELRIKKIFHKYNIAAKFVYHSDYKKLGKLRKDNDTPAYIELFVFLLRDSGKMLNRFSANTIRKNLFYWSSEEIQHLMVQTSQKVSLRDRFPLYRKVNRIIHDNANVIDLYYVGHTNYFHHCYEIAQPELSFNPNAFYQLKTLKRKRNCILK